MTTLLVYAPALAHTRAHHPENRARLAYTMEFLEKAGIVEQVRRLEAIPATEAQLRRVHTANLIGYVRRVSEMGGGLLDHGDTYVTADSYDLAQLAAGGCCRAVDLIMQGEARNGFALIRPPGHHAETDRSSGFCLFNNAAAAARQAQVVHGASRVAIVDFDVHQGNGTQDIFYEDDSVLFVSVHLFAPYFYPGTGSLDETGRAGGIGQTMNAPMPEGVGDAGYQKIFDEVVLPRVEAFAPEMLLVSAGFDAHWKDPLAMAGLSLTGYARITQRLIELAGRVCDGRVLFVLEGGYQLDVLNYGIINVFSALLGHDEVIDPYGRMPAAEQSVDELLNHLKLRHLSNQ